MQTPQPIIVHVVQQPVDSTTVADVLIGAFGLIGVMVLVAVVLGLAFGGILIGVKILRARYRVGPDSDAIHIV